ncbi:MAG TPA: YjfB family protein [Candidatus Paceibacterota bacterium]|nr:YjfB family protein [Verrucomicrobiota bacterium]HRY49060.1 YjfB family protein [Candidatus Paceibacterota bacterium]
MVVHAGDLKGQRFQVVEHPNDFFLKFRGDVPMTRYMTVSSQPAVSLLESVMIAEKTRTDIGVAVLKKAQDVTKAQGAAMIELLEEVGSNSVAEHLDVYA